MAVDCCLNPDPLGRFEANKDVEESFASDRREEDRWLKAGRAGASPFCLLGTVEALFNGGGGDPDGVEFDDNRSSHIPASSVDG